LQTTALNYKLIKKIKDDRFDEENLHQYSLLVSIGTRDLQVGVIESAEERVLLLEDYVFPSVSSHAELMQTLEQLFDSHAVLKAAFWKKIKICLKNNKFVQVPDSLFVEESQHEYLKYNAQFFEDEETAIAIRNPRTEAITIFALQRDLKSWLTSLYPNSPPVFMHQSAVLIEGMLDIAVKKQEDNLYIYVDRFKLHIVACQSGKLLYYNHFVIKEFSDYIRYIMLVMKSLNRDQRSSRVMLWGYIAKNSLHYQEFYKYINNVVFGPRPSHLKFGYMFDEIQDHHYFDLYSMHLLGND
jgi:hypothetical protein